MYSPTGVEKIGANRVFTLNLTKRKSNVKTIGRSHYLHVAMV